MNERPPRSVNWSQIPFSPTGKRASKKRSAGTITYNAKENSVDLEPVLNETGEEIHMTMHDAEGFRSERQLDQVLVNEFDRLYFDELAPAIRGAGVEPSDLEAWTDARAARQKMYDLALEYRNATSDTERDRVEAQMRENTRSLTAIANKSGEEISRLQGSATEVDEPIEAGIESSVAGGSVPASRSKEGQNVESSGPVDNFEDLSPAELRTLLQRMSRELASLRNALPQSAINKLELKSLESQMGLRRVNNLAKLRAQYGDTWEMPQIEGESGLGVSAGQHAAEAVTPSQPVETDGASSRPGHELSAVPSENNGSPFDDMPDTYPLGNARVAAWRTESGWRDNSVKAEPLPTESEKDMPKEDSGSSHAPYVRVPEDRVLSEGVEGAGATVIKQPVDSIGSTEREQSSAPDELSIPRVPRASRLAEAAGVNTEREELLAAERALTKAEKEHYKKGFLRRSVGTFFGSSTKGERAVLETEMSKKAFRYEQALESSLQARLDARGLDPAKRAALAARYRRMIASRDVFERSNDARLHAKKEAEAERFANRSDAERAARATGAFLQERSQALNDLLEKKTGSKVGARVVRVLGSAAVGATAAALIGPAGIAALGFSPLAFRAARSLVGTFGGGAIGAAAGKVYDRFATRVATERKRSYYGEDARAGDYFAGRGGEKERTSSDFKDFEMRRRLSEHVFSDTPETIARRRAKVEALVSLAAGAGTSLALYEAFADPGLVHAVTGSHSLEHGQGAHTGASAPAEHSTAPAGHQAPPRMQPTPQPHETQPVRPVLEHIDRRGSVVHTPQAEQSPVAAAHPEASAHASHPTVAPERPHVASATPLHEANPQPGTSGAARLSVEVRPGQGWESAAHDLYDKYKDANFASTFPPKSDMARLWEAASKGQGEFNNELHRLALEHHIGGIPKGSTFTVNEHGAIEWRKPGAHGVAPHAESNIPKPPPPPVPPAVNRIPMPGHPDVAVLQQHGPEAGKETIEFLNQNSLDAAQHNVNMPTVGAESEPHEAALPSATEHTVQPITTDKFNDYIAAHPGARGPFTVGPDGSIVDASALHVQPVAAPEKPPVVSGVEQQNIPRAPQPPQVAQEGVLQAPNGLSVDVRHASVYLTPDKKFVVYGGSYLDQTKAAMDYVYAHPGSTVWLQGEGFVGPNQNPYIVSIRTEVVGGRTLLFPPQPVLAPDQVNKIIKLEDLTRKAQ